MRNIQWCCTSCTLFTVTENVKQLLHVTYGFYLAHDSLYFSHLFPSLFFYIQRSGTGSSPDVIWGSTNWKSGHVSCPASSYPVRYLHPTHFSVPLSFPQKEVRVFRQTLLATRKANVRKVLTLSDVQPCWIGRKRDTVLLILQCSPGFRKVLLIITQGYHMCNLISILFVLSKALYHSHIRYHLQQKYESHKLIYNSKY